MVVLLGVIITACVRDDQALNTPPQNGDAVVIGGCRFVGPVSDIILFSKTKTLTRDCTMIWAEKANPQNEILISGAMDLKYVKHGVYELVGFFADIKKSSIHRKNSEGTRYKKLPRAAPLLKDLIIEKDNIVYIGNLNVDVAKSKVVPLAIEIELNEEDARRQIVEKVADLNMNKDMQVNPMRFSEDTIRMRGFFDKK